MFIEEIYEQLSKIILEARSCNPQIHIAGDMNAEVQSSTCTEDEPGGVGHFANTIGNDRGAWLANWASKEKLFITTQCFKRDGDIDGLIFNMAGSE